MNTKRILAVGGVLVLALTYAACVDFDVTNPGPVQDQNLEFEGAHEPLVLGAQRSTLDAIDQLALLGGCIVRDYHHGGHTGSFGCEEEEEIGRLTDEWTDNGGWSNGQQGRWIAEHAIERFNASIADPENYGRLARAHLWAGLASRTLGENYCTAVIDGGTVQPRSLFFTRAIDHFDDAERIANNVGDDDTRFAAIGARASAHLYLQDFSAAAADAALVAFDFVYEGEYVDQGSPQNTMGGVAGFDFKGITFWNHPFEEYFLTVGDERVAWGYDTTSGRGQFDVTRPTWELKLPMYYPIKLYKPLGALDILTNFNPVRDDQRGQPMNLVTGHEMALIQAEADLGSMMGFASAMTFINSVRTAHDTYDADLSVLRQTSTFDLDPIYTGAIGVFDGSALPAVTAANSTEAWTALKWERLIELNMEGRRMGDRHRWRTNASPGDIHPLEFLPQFMVDKYGVPADIYNLCFPMPQSENDRNDNIDITFKDWLP